MAHVQGLSVGMGRERMGDGEREGALGLVPRTASGGAIINWNAQEISRGIITPALSTHPRLITPSSHPNPSTTPHGHYTLARGNLFT